MAPDRTDSDTPLQLAGARGGYVSFHLLVKLDEPSPETAATILRGLKERYEVHHGVEITDPAIVAAAPPP